MVVGITPLSPCAVAPLLCLLCCEVQRCRMSLCVSPLQPRADHSPLPVRASMYTIAVSGLPPDVTEEELYEHFGGLIKSKNSPIVGISLAYDNTVEIKTCKKRGELIRSKVRMVHEHRHKCTELRKKGLDEEVLTKTIEEERNKFYEKMKKTNTELKAIEEELARLSELAMNVVYAYITFDKSSDRNKILEIYQRVSLYTYLCSNAHLRIKGKYIRGKPPPFRWFRALFQLWGTFV